MKNRLRVLLTFFFKLEEKLIFKILEDDKSIELSKNTVDFSVSVSLDSINRESYRTSELSDIYKELNAGHLIPLTCGHNGLYSPSELEALQTHLINSNILNST